MKNNSRKGILNKKPVAQGTIEYLVVVAVIVVISLVVVGLVANQADSFQGISSTAGKMSSSYGSISISEAVVDSDGDGLVSFSNNSGGLLIITGLSVGGVDLNYPSTSLYQGETKIFALSDVNSGCSCVGLEGKTKTCEVIIYAESEYGLEQQFNTTVSVNCASNVTPVNLLTVIQPIQEPSQEAGPSYSIVLGLKNSFDNLPLTGFDIDCDGTDYDFTDQNSPKTIDFNEGSYSCTFSKSGYDSNAITVTADSNKSLGVYLNPQIDYIHFSSCGTLNVSGAYYFLDNDIGSGGECIIIAANDIKINGDEHTITGDINASKTDVNAFTGLVVSNCIVDGNVSSFGWDGPTTSAGKGGSVTISNSNIESVNLNGGIGLAGDYKYFGGAGGAVAITNSTIVTVTANGGSGGAPYWYGEPTDYGGTGGTVTVYDSNISTIEASGGAAIRSEDNNPGGAVSISGSNVTTITATGGYRGIGGTATVTSSIVDTITTTGGAWRAAGLVTITDSTVGTITATGGAGGSGGPVSVSDSNIETITSTGSYGGSNGEITLTGSNATTITAGEVSTTDSNISTISGSELTATDSNILAITTSGGTVTATGSIIPSIITTGGAVTVTDSTVSAINTVGGSGGNGGNISITSSDLDLANVVLNLDYGTGTPHGIAGILTLSYTNSFVDMDANYGINLTALKVIHNGIGEINWFKANICTETPDNNDCGQWTPGDPWGNGDACIAYENHYGQCLWAPNYCNDEYGGNCSSGGDEYWCTNYIYPTGCVWTPDPGVCGGTGSGCEGITSMDTCNYQYEGCVWSGSGPGTCSGALTCGAQNSRDACNYITGCFWLDSFESSSLTNLSSNITLGSNSAYLNSTALPELNIDANVTLDLTGLGITNPQIKKSGVNCNSPDCNIISYNSETIIFTVKSWDNATYTVAQAS